MNKLKSMLPIILTALAGLVAAGIATYLAYDQYSEKRSEEKEKLAAKEQARISQAKADTFQNELRSSQERLQIAQLENLDLAQKANIKAEQIIASNNQLIEAQGETIKKITGDGYVTVRARPAASDSVTLYLENDGDYPLYEAQVTIFDVGTVKHCDYELHSDHVLIDYKCWETTKHELPPVTINPNMRHKTDYTINRSEFPKFLFIKTTYRHTRTNQYLIIHKGLEDQSLVFNVYQIFDVADENNLKLLVAYNNQLVQNSIWQQEFFFYKKRTEYFPF